MSSYHTFITEDLKILLKDTDEYDDIAVCMIRNNNLVVVFKDNITCKEDDEEIDKFELEYGCEGCSYREANKREVAMWG